MRMARPFPIQPDTNRAGDTCPRPCRRSPIRETGLRVMRLQDPQDISLLVLLENHLERSDLDDASIVQQRIVDDSAIHPCPIE